MTENAFRANEITFFLHILSAWFQLMRQFIEYWKFWHSFSLLCCAMETLNQREKSRSSGKLNPPMSFVVSSLKKDVSVRFELGKPI